jgi:uncharacterized protein YycO
MLWSILTTLISSVTDDQLFSLSNFTMSFVYPLMTHWSDDVYNVKKNMPEQTHVVDYTPMVWSTDSSKIFDPKKDIKDGDCIIITNGTDNDGIGHSRMFSGWKSDISATFNAQTFTTLEADFQVGVEYAAMDASNFTGCHVYKINNIDAQTVNNTIQWITENALGTDYNIPILMCKGNYEWYNKAQCSSYFCSELLWTAFIKNGVDINSYDWKKDGNLPANPGCSPANIDAWCSEQVEKGCATLLYK